SMTRELTDISVDLLKQEKMEEVRHSAERNAEERLLDLLLPGSSISSSASPEEKIEAENRRKDTRKKIRMQLRNGALDSRVVEMEVKEKSFSSFSVFSNAGIEDIDVNLKEMMPGLFSGKTKRRKMRV